MSSEIDAQLRVAAFRNICAGKGCCQHGAARRRFSGRRLEYSDICMSGGAEVHSRKVRVSPASFAALALAI